LNDEIEEGVLVGTEKIVFDESESVPGADLKLKYEDSPDVLVNEEKLNAVANGF